MPADNFITDETKPAYTDNPKSQEDVCPKPITYHRVANMLGRRPIATHIRAYRISRISLLQGLHGKRYIEKHKAETQNPY